MLNEYFSNNIGIVTLCGSTKFFKECLEINRLLTLNGWIVLMCGFWGHSYHKDKMDEMTDADFDNLKNLHFKKIKISNAVIIVSDQSKYYGDSTKLEIDFAKKLLLPVYYYYGENSCVN